MLCPEPPPLPYVQQMEMHTTRLPLAISHNKLKLTGIFSALKYFPFVTDYKRTYFHEVKKVGISSPTHTVFLTHAHTLQVNSLLCRPPPVAGF